MKEIENTGVTKEELIKRYRRNQSSQEDIPVLQGTFRLKGLEIKMISDSKLSGKSQPNPKEEEIRVIKSEENGEGRQSQQDEESNEIVIYSRGFDIEYNHYDAQDLNTKYQIQLNATCQDFGVQFIKKQWV